jgi:hypothetical protein
MHSGKVLETVPLTSPMKTFSWFHKKAGKTPKPATPTLSYLVRDVCTGKKSGYVVLSQEPVRDGEERPQPAVPRESREIRLFVRHPRLFQAGGAPALRLVGRMVSPTARPDGPVQEFKGSALTLVRSGRDWALFSLRGGEGRIDPTSLTPMIGPILTTWGDGFFGPEVDAADNTRWWRWSDRRGVLVLHNITGEFLKIKVSMWLRGEGDAPLLLACGASRSVVNARWTPVRIELELALAPGQNLVEIRSGGSPIKPYRGDHRTLFFAVSDFKVREVRKRGFQQAASGEGSGFLQGETSLGLEQREQVADADAFLKLGPHSRRPLPFLGLGRKLADARHVLPREVELQK